MFFDCPMSSTHPVYNLFIHFFSLGSKDVFFAREIAASTTETAVDKGIN